MRIGCSGWIYPHWRGLFYPEKLPVKRWFAYYAEQFDTVEINNSFYSRPVWAYFNNDSEAHAIADAQTLRGMVRQALR